MKKSFIIAFALIGVAVALLISASKDFSTYSSFSKAKKNGGVVKIVGQLAKEQEIYYEPDKDANFFSFYLTDKEGQTKKVILKAPKPQDFELSEQVVLTGTMTDDLFMAKTMLLKCPSKYKDEEIYIKSTVEL
ncbi:MAG: cytochrome c maturation protein CcmE [Saprospiraceae bacterium]|nr:cytochrome c maturation protein CcmE [Saprospiraceae bacterium]MBK8449913.1 cytochrome c maturation protein CcmE [Saprospiraceae bacterium]MBK8484030.1 cytochrome c maturation protein CcmE [Saprospiraceae bacterium]MBK9221434.1 cytochrome c maturation protein CcmE [Saprospiraceae bacterium]MBK9721628.1 cytochrome c maturation protein CcmE [Saprospiraceae bacterium]